jgi:predicted O-methyltransferase YrrM
MYERAVRMAPDPAFFVEIGCYLGRSTSCLGVEAVNSGKSITIYAIDLWDTSKKIGCTVEEFYKNVEPINKKQMVKIHPMRGDSVALASDFKDKSLDFVWVDGNHNYNACLADIKVWWPKLKNGGWMGGDDLIHGGVRMAVEEFFGPECDRYGDQDGAWVRFQSATCHYGKIAKDIRPAAGGWVWWARSKSKDWTPKGIAE